MSTVKWTDNLVTSGGDIRLAKNTSLDSSSHKTQPTACQPAENSSHKKSGKSKKSRKSQEGSLSNSTSPEPPKGTQPHTESKKSKKALKSKKSKESEISGIELQNSKLLETEQSEIKLSVDPSPGDARSPEPLYVLAARMITMKQFNFKTQVC